MFPSERSRARVGSLCIQTAAVGLAVWAGSANPVWIAPAAALGVAGAILSGAAGRSLALASTAILAGVAAALGAEFHLDHLSRTWPERSGTRESAAQEQLAVSIDAVLRAAEEATLEVAARWDPVAGAGSELPAELRPPAVDALAVFGPSGALLAWDGTHQGPVPERARRGASRYVYEEGAIFGYLYVTEVLPGGEAVVAASLLRSDLPPGLERAEEDFEARFRASAGADIEVASADRAVAGSVWDLEWEGESLFSVRLRGPSEADARERIGTAWGRIVALFLAAGWLLALVSMRGDGRTALVGVSALPLAVLLLPLARLTGSPEVFSPAALLLPGPISLTLGEVLALGVAGVLGVALLPWERLPRAPAYLAAPAAVVVAAGGLFLLERGSSEDLPAAEGTVWIVFQAAATAMVLLPLTVAALAGRPGHPVSYRFFRLAGWLTLGLLLSLGWVAVLEQNPGSVRWAPWIWTVPLLGVTKERLLPRRPARRRPLGGARSPLRCAGAPLGVGAPHGGPHGSCRGEDRTARHPVRPLRGVPPREGGRAGRGACRGRRATGRDPVQGLERERSRCRGPPTLDHVLVR